MPAPRMIMRFTLAEEDGGGSYEFDPKKLMLQEATMVERITGGTVQEWLTGIQKGSALSMGALLFMLKKRSGEKTGDFSQFNINLLGIGSEAVDEDGKVLSEEDLQKMLEDEAAPKSTGVSAPKKKSAAT